MEFYRQDDKFLEINKIKDIQAISLTSLMRTKDANEGIPVLVVTYDNGFKMLCYAGTDKEFIHFYEIVRRVYESESELRDILIDNETKNFILNKTEELKLDDLKKEIGSVSTENKKINYKIKENEMYFKVLKFVLESVLKFLNRNVQIENIKGINKTFALFGTEDGLSVKFPFNYTYDTDSNKRVFIFPGIFEGIHELTIEIKEGKNLNIEFKSANNKILGTLEFIVNESKGICNVSLYTDGVCIYKKASDLEALENNQYEEIFKLIGINGKPFILPWGDIRVVNSSFTKGEIEESITKITDFRVNLDGTHISVIENLTGTLSKDNFKGIKGKLSLTSLQERKITNLYLVKGEENHIVRETSFMPSLLGRGIYKSELAGKHFYKIYKVNGCLLDKLEPNSILECLNAVEENKKGYQLLDEFELKLILRRVQK